MMTFRQASEPEGVYRLHGSP